MISVETATMDMSALGGSGVSIRIKGRDLDKLQQLAREVSAIVASVEGTANVSDGTSDSSEELRIIVDREKAIEHGLTVAQVFQQINAKITDKHFLRGLKMRKQEKMTTAPVKRAIVIL